MIKSIKKGTYGDSRTGTKYAFIESTITSFQSTPNGRIYQLENYLVEDGVKKINGQPFSVSISNEKLSQLDKYLVESELEFTKKVDGVDVPLFGNELEWAKLPHGLLIYVKTDFLLDENGDSTGKTVFWLDPQDWVLSTEEEIIRS
jgi:hypothetical protein